MSARQPNGRRARCCPIRHRLLGTLAILVAVLMPVAPHADSEGKAKFAQALKLLKSGSDDTRAVQLFEAAAVSGDVGAMYVLGAMNFEGKHVPQDRPLGIAYLKLAVMDEDPALKSVRGRAQEWIWAGEAEMNGHELIEVDQQFLRLMQEIKSNVAAKLARATRVFTDEVPVEYDPLVRFSVEPVRLRATPAGSETTPYMVGCGAKSLPTCPARSKSAEDKRCTGELLAVDAAASTRPADRVIIEAPEYPDPARRVGDQGTVRLLAHVDSSGWVCGVAVAISSGAPSLDTAALRAATKWRFNPATRGGTPAESLHSFAVTFRLIGW